MLYSKATHEEIEHPESLFCQFDLIRWLLNWQRNKTHCQSRTVECAARGVIDKGSLFNQSNLQQFRFITLMVFDPRDRTRKWSSFIVVLYREFPMPILVDQGKFSFMCCFITELQGLGTDKKEWKGKKTRCGHLASDAVNLVMYSLCMNYERSSVLWLSGLTNNISKCFWIQVTHVFEWVPGLLIEIDLNSTYKDYKRYYQGHSHSVKGTGCLHF